MKHSPKLFCEISKKYNPKYEFNARREWKLRGSKMNYPKAYIPPEVLKSINNSLEEMIISERYENEIKKNTVIDYDQFLNWKKPDIKKLLIKEDPIRSIERDNSYCFNQYKRFEYGDIQAALLTKTNIMDSEFRCLPPSILDISPNVLDRFIMKANWWTTDEDKFPKRFNSKKHIYKYKTEFGISIKNNIRYLLRDLLNYSQCFSNTKDFRLFNKDHLLETFYFWNGKRIQFQESRDFVVSSDKPLVIFEKESFKWEPEKYITIMNPVNPCIDLKVINRYPLESNDGWSKENVIHKYPHLITVNLDLPNVHTDFLEPEGRQITQSQKNAIGIMNCFAQSIATARRLFGDKIVDECKEKLPHPICVHAICFDSVQFDFISYQLNSTDFNSTEFANLAWIDNNHKFFTKIISENGMLRNTRYENLNTNVFSKFLQYFQYGIMTGI